MTGTHLTILFADIAQSTRLYDILGDQTAENLIGTCICRLTEVASRHEGTVIKTIGDEVMCTFPELRNGVDAAKAMHTALEERFDAGEGARLSPNLKVGLHSGPVIHRENDVFGDAVNLAARLVQLSKSRQILVSKAVVDALDPARRRSTRSLGRIPVRGKSGDMHIFELIWEEYDMTVIAEQALASPDARACMELTFGKWTLRVGPDNASVTLGRDPRNDLVLSGNHVSRSHARIDFLAGKFLLSDQSSNGTWVTFRNGETVHLRRDKVVLYGSGAISPGIRSKPGSPGAVRFLETS
jgi:class 3 adenylate cyclase